MNTIKFNLFFLLLFVSVPIFCQVNTTNIPMNNTHHQNIWNRTNNLNTTNNFNNTIVNNITNPGKIEENPQINMTIKNETIENEQNLNNSEQFEQKNANENMTNNNENTINEERENKGQVNTNEEPQDININDDKTNNIEDNTTEDNIIGDNFNENKNNETIPEEIVEFNKVNVNQDNNNNNSQENNNNIPDPDMHDDFNEKDYQGEKNENEHINKLKILFEKFLLSFHNQLLKYLPVPYDYIFMFVLGYFFMKLFTSGKSSIQIRKRKILKDPNVMEIEKKLKQISEISQQLGNNRGGPKKQNEIKLPKISINLENFTKIEKKLNSLLNDLNERNKDNSAEKNLQNNICAIQNGILEEVNKQKDDDDDEESESDERNESEEEGGEEEDDDDKEDGQDEEGENEEKEDK